MAEALERYLGFERVDPKQEDALFPSFKPQACDCWSFPNLKGMKWYAGWKFEKGKFRFIRILLKTIP